MIQRPSRRELRDAFKELHSRGLTIAAEWAAEQLHQFPSSINDQDDSGTDGMEEGMGMSIFTSAEMSERECDAYMLGRSYFDTQQYARAAYFLEGATSPKAVFFQLYCQYMAGEKRKREEELEQVDSSSGRAVKNSEVDEIISKLENFGPKLSQDPFLLFLYGLALLRSQRKAEAAQQLEKSVKLYPCNWQAWLALQECFSSWNETVDAQLPDHWARECFLAKAGFQFSETKDTLSRLQQMDTVMPYNSFVYMMLAKVQYQIYNFQKTMELLKDIFERDPYRLDGADTYSNVLWMQKQHVELSVLAQKAVRIDKFCVETCCVVGNYYALAKQHEKAITYFKRAISLDRSNVEAWILLGHEYIEERNLEAAKHAYSNAVQIQPNDSRCYYGLGYAYQLSDQPTHAIHYFKKAAQTSEENSMVWNQLGKCFQHNQIKDLNKAIVCFKRAYDNSTNNPQIRMSALKSLAKTHKLLEQKDLAASYYEKLLKVLDENQHIGEDIVDVLWFLANYYLDKGYKDKAKYYCVRLQDYGGPNRIRSRQLLEEIQRDNRNN